MSNSVWVMGHLDYPGHLDCILSKLHPLLIVLVATHFYFLLRKILGYATDAGSFGFVDF